MAAHAHEYAHALLTSAPAQGTVREGSGSVKHFHLQEEGGMWTPEP